MKNTLQFLLHLHIHICNIIFQKWIHKICERCSQKTCFPLFYRYVLSLCHIIFPPNMSMYWLALTTTPIRITTTTTMRRKKKHFDSNLWKIDRSGDAIHVEIHEKKKINISTWHTFIMDSSIRFCEWSNFFFFYFAAVRCFRINRTESRLVCVANIWNGCFCMLFKYHKILKAYTCCWCQR